MTVTLDRSETSRAATVAPRLVAVIDVGTTSLRMAVAEIDEQDEVRTLETLSQAVSLGKDTFTTGSIEKSTIEACVRALRNYRQVLDEYRIVEEDAIRVVATSAVREAQNRLAFLDRVFSATGFRIEVVDEAEVNRITYLGVQPQLRGDPQLAGARAIVAEVGAGSTEVLVLQDGEVLFSRAYRLGSLRLRETLERYRAPEVNRRAIMSEQIARTVERIVDGIREQLGLDLPTVLVAMGGDVRFAAQQLIPDWSPEQIGRLPLSEFDAFSDRMLEPSEDELVRRYHLTFPDAETLAPALLAYRRLAHAFELDAIHVSNANLRDGLLREMVRGGRWSEELQRQIVRSATDLGRKYAFDEDHARHVADLSVKLFRELAEEHKLSPRYELLLYVAALLHEIGGFVSSNSHHKHSYYLISNSDLFGLGKREMTLVALVARYHRRASPKPNHVGYSSLRREQRIAVSKMAALLRVADALDRSHGQRLKDIECRLERDRLVITVPHVDDVTLEQLALRQKGTLFEEIFGPSVLLRTRRV